MLRKLLKYELYSTARVFLPFYLALLVLSVVARTTVWNYTPHPDSTWMDILLGLSLGFYIIAIVAVFLLTTVVSVVRYYRNLYGDEGYLMQTLPVTADQLLWSKLLISSLWSILSMGMILLSLGILVWQKETWLIAFQEIAAAWNREIAPLWTGSMTLAVVEFCALCLFSTIVSTLSYYTAITLGQLMGKHRILGAVVSYIGITIVIELFVTFVTTVLMPVVAGPVAERFLVVIDESGQVAQEATISNAMAVVHGFLWFLAAMVLIQGVAQYLLTRWVMVHKTNLA